MFIRLLSRTTLAGATALLIFGGCATVERHPDIPASALMAAEGNERLAYNPTEGGEIYVYDVTNEEMVYAGEVKRDEIVVVDPGQDRITVDQRIVSEQNMDAGNIHRIFFAPRGTTEVRRIEEEIRVLEER